MSDDEAMLDTEDVVGTVGDSDNEEIDDIDCIEMTDVNLNEGKNKVIITNPEKRVSKNKMTKYELVRIIGERIKQLTMGAKPMIKMAPKSEQYTYSEIAIEELKLNMIPFKIRRPVKDHYEIWSIKELDKKHLESLYY